MRMLQLRCDFDLALEAFGAKAFGEVGVEYLYDHLPAERRVVGDEDTRHTSTRELALERVRAAQRGLDVRAQVGRHARQMYGRASGSATTPPSRR